MAGHRPGVTSTVEERPDGDGIPVPAFADTPCCMLICMHSTSVRIDASTHEDLKRLAAELKTTVGNTVSLAVRAFRQDRIGEELHRPLGDDELAWLDADLG